MWVEKQREFNERSDDDFIPESCRLLLKNRCKKVRIKVEKRNRLCVCVWARSFCFCCSFCCIRKTEDRSCARTSECERDGDTPRYSWLLFATVSLEKSVLRGNWGEEKKEEEGVVAKGSRAKWKGKENVFFFCLAHKEIWHMEFYVKSYLDRQIKRGICGKHNIFIIIISIMRAWHNTRFKPHDVLCTYVHRNVCMYIHNIIFNEFL